MLILASTSPFRRAILANAGLIFDTDKPTIDERSVEAPLLASGATPSDIALVLAQAKALDVSARNPGKYVIGGDQTLSLDDDLLHKANTDEEARRKLLALAGKTHSLNSALAIAQDNQIVWEHVSTAHMTMRPLAPAYIGRYLAQIGAAAFQSVGAYQIEGPGINLFEKIDGDHFTIIGLPLLPLLAQLRRLEVIDG